MQCPHLCESRLQAGAQLAQALFGLSTAPLSVAALPAFDAACAALASQLRAADAGGRAAMLGPQARLRWRTIAPALQRAGRSGGLDRQRLAPGLQLVQDALDGQTAAQAAAKAKADRAMQALLQVVDIPFLTIAL